jgi:hypothetical protein
VGGKPTNVATLAAAGGSIMKMKSKGYAKGGAMKSKGMAKGGAMNKKPAGKMRPPSKKNSGLYG